MAKLTSSTYNDDQLNARMQLHNISEISEYNQPPQRPQHRPTPKENLYSLTQRISNEDLRIAIQMELNKLVSEYDQYITVLQQRSDVLEQEYESLQMLEETSQRRYEKAVREMQFFKKKYDKLAELTKQQNCRPRSPSVDSSSIPTSPPPSVSGSETSNPLYSNHFYPPHSLPPPPPIPTSTSDKNRHLSRSSSSSTTSSNASLPFNLSSYENIPLPRLRQNSNVATANSVHSNGASSVHSNSSENGKFNLLQGRKGSWQQSDGPVPHVSRSTTNASQSNGHISASVIQQRKVDPLTFGGSDSFWETISKSSDQSIEKLISNFLRRGGSPNTAKQSSSYKSIKYGYGLIHCIIALKALSSLDLLLYQGANPNASTLSQVDEDKVTPSYLASSLGWLQGLEALVNAGADLTIARGGGNKNKTALHVAAENCHVTIVEYIVSNTPSNFHAQVDSMGSNALHYAALSGHTDILSFLIQHCQLNVDQINIRGETPLHWASRAGQLETASFLIERCGADFNAYVPKKSNTPYDMAKSGSHKRLVEYYKKIGALPTKKMEKRREEEAEKEVPVHLQSALTKNGLFGF